jgi:hypothetical protein
MEDFLLFCAVAGACLLLYRKGAVAWRGGASWSWRLQLLISWPFYLFTQTPFMPEGYRKVSEFKRAATWRALKNAERADMLR